MSNQGDVTQSRSLSYEDFSNLVRNEQLNVKKSIDSAYRYQDDEGKERFYYHETLRVKEGSKGHVTCFNGCVGNSIDFPTSEEFEWNKANLAKVSKHFTPKTNFYIVMSGSSRSKITKEQFMNWERADIEVGFKQVKVDIQELASQIADATAARKK